MGCKPAPEIARYRKAGRLDVVYVIELGHMVKVGRSRKPGWRLSQLHHIHTKRGEPVGRFCTFPTSRRSYWVVEREAIQALTKLATPVPGRIEYFTGIAYEDALQVVAQFTA